MVTKDSDKDWGPRTWTLNVTTWDRLLDAFSDDEDKWIGKKVRVRVKEENVRGTPRQVLYGEPYVKAK